MLVLLDRDGVLNRDAPQGILRVEDLVLLPRAAEAVSMLTQHGFHTTICTNQSAVGRGRLSLETLDAIHARLCHEIAAHGGRIDAIFVAPDAPDAASDRRKPGAGMLREALARFDADPAQTPMIGDMLRDMEAAAAAGCPRMLVRTGKGAAIEAAGLPDSLAPITVHDDLYAAATWLCNGGGR